ncbi:MAG: phosphoheptose isomerase [Saprospiraceae bacterium]|nr:phosphoheptose isomerase [Saprospiraceae bacterium]
MADDFVYTLDAQGHPRSPELAKGKRNYLIDIDGTICEDIPNEEPERMKDAKIYKGALEFVNRLYEEGHQVYFFTSRTEDLRKITEEWLNQHGFLYHGMVMGKPRGGNYHWLDNHMVTFHHYNGSFPEIESHDKKI